MSSTALRTLPAVRSFSFSGELKNRETVAVETPAAAATSLMVTLVGGGRGRSLRRARGYLVFERFDVGILQSSVRRSAGSCAIAPVSKLFLALTSEMQAFTK